MFRNYLIIAFRNIKKNKVYSVLNIFGLAIGMAVFILIFLYVQYELSFDRWHQNADRVYRVVQTQPGNMYLGSDRFAVTAAPLAAALMQEYPEVVAATRIDNLRESSFSYGDKKFVENSALWADPNFLKIFSIELLSGNPETVLSDPHSILFSESMAKKYFDNADPLGKTILYNEKHDMVVTGIYKDLPKNSHFTMDIVIPFDAQKTFSNRNLDTWGSSSYFTYFLLQEGADPEALEDKFPALLEKYSKGKGLDNTKYYLQPLTQIHLHSNINFELAPNSDIKYIYLFSSIALLILLIACINYINLATARSAKRSKEVGLRKVVGAHRHQLFRQFLGESTLITFFALLLTLGLIALSLPAFNRFVEREIAFNPTHNLGLLLGILITFALVALLAGGYPAAHISRFRPISALKSSSERGKKSVFFRNTLVVFQFLISILLILSTIVIRSQLRYIQNKEMGYNREHIVVLRPRDENLRKQIDVFKTNLKGNPDILNVSASSSLPNHVSSSEFADWPGKPEDLDIPIYVCEGDYDFVDVFELKMALGRNFSRKFPSDANGAFLINESAVKVIGWDSPIGQEFGWENEEPFGQVVGVLKDFHMHSLHQEIEPLYVSLRSDISSYVSIKIRGENIPDTLAFIEETFKPFSPTYPFEFSFFDEVFDRAYKAEQKIGSLFNTFSLLTIFIACLGLFGLASFTAETRTKEIGIRKVLGASVPSIIQLLNQEYVKKVILAALVAWPLGFYSMSRWLQNFHYRIKLGVIPFLAAGLIALAIALITVSFQTFRAAAANPADSLHYE
ncbi:MAG: ABC transporter permease [Candidatus Aminicenantes bacterium]|nr:ABC transporter permease [Candidatus Aminicenantes bacterium]